MFFKLRNTDVNDLISSAVEDKTRILLKKAGKRTSRVMDDIDFSGLFGIGMEETAKDKAESPLLRTNGLVEKNRVSSSAAVTPSKKRRHIIPGKKVVPDKKNNGKDLGRKDG